MCVTRPVTDSAGDAEAVTQHVGGRLTPFFNALSYLFIGCQSSPAAFSNWLTKLTQAVTTRRTLPPAGPWEQTIGGKRHCGNTGSHSEE